MISLNIFDFLECSPTGKIQNSYENCRWILNMNLRNGEPKFFESPNRFGTKRIQVYLQFANEALKYLVRLQLLVYASFSSKFLCDEYLSKKSLRTSKWSLCVYEIYSQELQTQFLKRRLAINIYLFCNFYCVWIVKVNVIVHIPWEKLSCLISIYYNIVCFR